jgi:uncharacterized protein YecE (DUF72 family)
MPLISEITADHIFIRWEGDRKAVKGNLGKTETDRTKDIQEWAKKIKPIRDKGTRIFGYFSKYYSGFPTNDVKEIQKLL